MVSPFIAKSVQVLAIDVAKPERDAVSEENEGESDKDDEEVK
jgi:hypothetical protein